MIEHGGGRMEVTKALPTGCGWAGVESLGGPRVGVT